MNNEQFRRLVLNNPSSVRDKDKSPNGPSPRQHGGSTVGGATPNVLGSRMRSSIPMTPRSVKCVDFARQLAEHRRESQQPPTKKFKSSAAPKGTKLAAGYQDRSVLRRQQDEAEAEVEDKEKRVKALEEMVKLGQIDRSTFEKLRVEIGVGGDVSSTHLVKGLDWNLLKRVKAGEDVTKPEEVPPETEGPGVVEDVDEEFDRILEEKEKDVLPTAPKEEKVKKGNMAPPQPAASTEQKRSRDEILKQLKASRAAAATAPPEPEPTGPALGSKFKKIGDSKQRWIEEDENGRRREVLITKDAEGKTKRKVRYLDKPREQNGGLLAPDKNAKPLGMEIPAEIAAKMAAVPEEEEDGDIFEGIGADYNPLGDLGDEDSSSESEAEAAISEGETALSKAAVLEPVPSEIAEKAAAPAKPRNYFSVSATAETTESHRANPFATDPTIVAALKRAAQLRQAAESAEVAGEEAHADAETLARRKKFLEEAKRREAQDAMDMDYGFGSSRIEDEEDEEGPTWDERGGNKRKRGPKKRKGNKDSAADVLRVLDARSKGEKSKE